MPRSFFVALFSALLFGAGAACAQSPPRYGSPPLTFSSLGAPNGAASLDGTGHLAAAQIPITVITSSQIGAANGIAALDSTVRLPVGELPISALTTSQLGVASGIAQLDSTGRLPAGQLPSSALTQAGGTLTGPLYLPANPTANLQTATKQYVDSGDAANAAAIATETANRTTAINSLLNTSAPFTISPQVPTVASTDNSNDAASTAFVQAVASSASSGLAPISPVNAVAGASNVTISAPGFTTLDGVTLVSGTSRIGLIDQTSAAQNGIYLYNGSSSALTRTTDANVAADFSNKQLYFSVPAGTAFGGNSYVLQNPGTVTLGTTPLNFVLFDSVTNYTAGGGLMLSGQQFAIDFGTTTGTVADGGALAAAAAAAATAQSTANTAATNASSALSTANTAETNAIAAGVSAGNAQTSANNAITDAAAAQASAATALTYGSSALPLVTSDTELRAVVTSGLTANSEVAEIGYRTPGDMPEAIYTLSNSACPDSAGAGDGGSQKPALGGGCWDLVKQPAYYPPQWGAVGGGADPYGTNAADIQNLIEFIASIHFSGAVDFPTIFWGGVTYGINSGIVDDATNDLIIGGPNIKVLSNLGGGAASTINPSGGNVCAIAWRVTAGNNHQYDHFEFDGNYQAAGLFSNEINGSPQYHYGYLKDWEGSCGGPTPQSGTTVLGSDIVTMSNTTGYFPGMVIHGNTDILPYMDQIVHVDTNADIILRLTATAAGTENILAYNDSFGIAEGGIYSAVNAGGMLDTINSSEYVGGDSRLGNPADAYGFSLFVNGGANDIQIINGLYENATAPVFINSGTGGVHFSGYQEMTNDSWTTPQPSPAAIVVADNGGNLVADHIGLGGDQIQGFQASASAINIDVGRVSYTGSSNSTGIAAIVQDWTNQTNASQANVNVNNLGMAGASSLIPVGIGGPGTWSGGSASTNQFPGPLSIAGPISAGSGSKLSGGFLNLTGNTPPANGANQCVTNDLCLYAANNEEFDITFSTTTVHNNLVVDGSISGPGVTSALAPYALLSAPAFTNPTANTQSTSDSSTLVATDAFVHAVASGIAIGQLVGIQTFTSASCSGGCTYTPDPGTTEVIVEDIGAGGGGGGAAATGSGASAVGQGGGAGSYAKDFLTSGFSGVTVTVPAGGAGGSSGGNGTTGSAATVGSAISCPGGIGGAGGGTHSAATIGGVSGRASACSVGSGTTLVSIPGPTSLSGWVLTAGSVAQSGAGANSNLGSGGAPTNAATAAGNAGGGFGAGGSGGSNASASEATAVGGGNGAPAGVIVLEFN